ncbi:MAG: PAS domain-containing protein [Cyanobacteria bacterium Co-bin13]|nr:PAS domain-containing protein [Cyanobacteria bacterium Co-bin13]
MELATSCRHFPGPVLALGAGGHVLDASQDWLNRLGYSLDRVLGQLWTEQVAEFDWPQAAALLHRCSQGEVVRGQQLCFVTAAGQFLSMTVCANCQPQSAEQSAEVRFLLLLTAVEVPAAEQILQQFDDPFRQLVENIPQAFWVLDPATHRVLYLSPAYETIWGRPCREIYENTLTLLESVHPEDRDRIRAAMQIEWEEGVPFNQEYRIVRPNGELRWIRDQSFPVSQVDLGIDRIFGLAEDITERKQAEDLLDSLAVETAAVTGTDFFPVLARQLASALAVSQVLIAEHAQGKAQTLAVWSDEQLCPNRSYDLAQTPCEIVAREGYYYCPNAIIQQFAPDLIPVAGQTVGYMGVALQDSQGMPIGHLCILSRYPLRHPDRCKALLRLFAIRAATELQRQRIELTLQQLNTDLEVRVQQRTAQLEAVNRELESFSYSVSHDLRAPLRHVRGFIDMLSQHLSPTADPTTAHYLETIQSSAHKMDQLIEGLLVLSRVGRRELKRQTVGLNGLVEGAIALLSPPKAAAANAVFSIAKLPAVEGDPILLQQVFSDLIDNALKFSQHRQPARIEVGILPDQTLYVRDNGIGFSMDQADQLFSPFQRLHSRGKFDGTGIGLAIVQRIVQRHGGMIWAESQPEQGTTFFFTLPESAEA